MMVIYDPFIRWHSQFYLVSRSTLKSRTVHLHEEHKHSHLYNTRKKLSCSHELIVLFQWWNIEVANCRGISEEIFFMHMVGSFALQFCNTGATSALFFLPLRVHYPWYINSIFATKHLPRSILEL